jgi:nucleotide-binding universal stress UspA family protein
MTATQTCKMTRPSATHQSSFQTIVVATDFSASAAAATEWAMELAQAHGAQIVLAHAIETELPALTEAQGLVRDVRQKLESARADLKAGTVVVCTECGSGRPWDVIAEIARNAKADLIIVGAHGQSRFSERVVGTVADRLIKSTSVPVLVHRSPTGNLNRRLRTALAATDFSEESVLAISAAVRLLQASTEPVRLVLFHTIALDINYGDLNTPMALPHYWDETERIATHQLESLAATLRSDKVQVEVETFRGFPAEAILREAELIKADLISIGTVGRSGMNRFFMGSVAQRVLHRAQCPVLTVRKPASDEPIRFSAV